MPKAILKLPRAMEVRARMVKACEGLSKEAKTEAFQAADAWAETKDNGREVLGTLNHRYDLCVLQCDSPAPWFAAAFDTHTEELVLAQEIPNGQIIDRATCARYCAQALGEEVEALQ